MMTYYKKCRIYGVVSVAFSVLFAFSEFAVAEPLSVFNGKTVVGVQQTKTYNQRNRERCNRSHYRRHSHGKRLK